MQGVVAQLVERLPEKQGVLGSIPSNATGRNPPSHPAHGLVQVGLPRRENDHEQAEEQYRSAQSPTTIEAKGKESFQKDLQDSEASAQPSAERRAPPLVEAATTRRLNTAPVVAGAHGMRTIWSMVPV